MVLVSSADKEAKREKITKTSKELKNRDLESLLYYTFSFSFLDFDFSKFSREKTAIFSGKMEKRGNRSSHLYRNQTLMNWNRVTPIPAETHRANVLLTPLPKWREEIIKERIKIFVK